jgi:hypothetical protein
LLIPWDPTVDQNTKIARYGKNVLRQRILTQLLIRLGRSHTGAELQIDYDDLLRRSTYGFYEHWQRHSPEVCTALRRFCRDSIVKALKNLADVDNQPLGEGRRGRRIVINTLEAREHAMDAITEYARQTTPIITKKEQLQLLNDDE